MEISYGSPDTVAMASGGTVPQSVYNHVAQRVASFVAAVGETAAPITNYVTNRINDVMYGETARRVNAMAAQVEHLFQENTVRRISTMSGMQNAPDDMCRYIMAHIPTRELYHAGDICGYGERYVDTQPGLTGNEHYDYRRVTSGMAMYDGETTISIIHTEQLHEEDISLSAMQKTAILRTWETMDDLYDIGDEIDPTDKWAGTIG